MNVLQNHISCITSLARNRRVGVALVISASSLVFFAANFTGGLVDLPGHIRIALHFSRNDLFPTPTGFYGLIIGASLLSDRREFLETFIIFLMVLAVTAKFVIFWNASERCAANTVQNKRITSIILLRALFVYGGLVSAPIYYGTTFYQGRFGINVWHNSTTVLVLPLCFILFFEAVSYLQGHTEKARSLILISLVATAIALIKPSFLFAFLPAFTFICVIKFGIKMKSFYIMLSLLPCVIPIILTYYYHYTDDDYAMGILKELGWKSAPYRIEWSDPFEIFLIYVEGGGIRKFVNFAFGSVLSVLFPIVFVIFYWKKAKTDETIVLSLVTMCFALAISAVFIETGHRRAHGNLTWQVYMANQVLFFACSLALLREKITNPKLDLKDKAALTVFGLHVVSGGLYVARFALLGRFA